MKTIAYLDCPSGISGDMFLGALIDAGVPLGYLHQHLSLLGLNQEFILSAQDTVKQGQRAKQACVTLSMQAPHIHSIPSVLDHEHANHPDGHGH